MKKNRLTGAWGARKNRRMMKERRIEKTTSRTAEVTCVSRAASNLETDPCYHSGDHLSPRLLPRVVGALIRIPPVRRFFVRKVAPPGIYEYVIARTKYIDTEFKKALDERFDQILLFGAGFDTRALRFEDRAVKTRVFELDIPKTQQAKIGQYARRGLKVPQNLLFIAIDFEKESVPSRLDDAGFLKNKRTLFILEGVLMYLTANAVSETFKVIQNYAGAGSRLVFDYVRESVLRGEEKLYGEKEITRSVGGWGEKWLFGLDPARVDAFLSMYGFQIAEHQDSAGLEMKYFRNESGRLIGRINQTHCLATAELLK